MPASMLFWVVYLIFLIFGLFLNWPANTTDRVAWRPFGSTLVIMILIGLLGLGVYGSPIK